MSATNSHVSFSNSQGQEARGSLVKLTRQMVIFEVYNPYSIVQLSEVLNELRILQGARETYKGRAVVTGLINTGLMLIVSASLVDPWSDLKGLGPGPVLRRFVRGFVGDWEDATASLEKPFQIAVTNLRNFLQELSRWLEHWETEAGIGDHSEADRSLNFVTDVDQGIEPRLTTLYGEFEDSTKEIDRKRLPYHRAFAQRELHPLMMCSPFMHRAFNKPLGYAGDYEMVRMMIGVPWEGNNTFAKLLNASALRHEAPAAHRNRIDLLQKALQRETHRVVSSHNEGVKQPADESNDQVIPKAQDGRFEVLNIGCGPAEEIKSFADADPVSGAADFTLVDFNLETLQHVRENLIPSVQKARPDLIISTEQRSVHEILQLSIEGGPKESKQYDMVYCAGLFDYFRDTTCGYLIKLFYSWVKEGGLVLVTNVSPSHSSVAIMGLVLDWNLELRDEKVMRSLAPGLGLQQTYVDRTGVNVFLEIRKPVT
ncbi:hypothetical protein CA13_56860 [Planctomycetes bacterium CA13]|uniref:Uncharacterized protein n=2 Tax=Novipirellula herctigrandis TaxID=2527986 RepID=A0A5C5ZAG7_9BACT|nr:hypothetical protein CA13_56860 [Planctomycetes bacterium CA13]